MVSINEKCPCSCLQKYFEIELLFILLAHFQNGEIGDELAKNLDVCLASDTQTEKAEPVLLAVSNNNVYDGYVNKDFPRDLKRTFIAIRKANSDHVSKIFTNS